MKNPKPSRSRNLYIDAETWGIAQKSAQKQGRSVSNYIRHLIRQAPATAELMGHMDRNRS